MKNQWKSFVFENWEWNAEKKNLSLRYSFDGEVQFSEEWWFDFDYIENINQDALNSAFKGLWIAAGVSYFKAGLPKNIVFRKTSDFNLQSSEKEFFEKAWTNGLGEFFYTNGIDPAGVVRFSIGGNETSNYKLQTSDKESLLKGAILPIGGGKDSLVSALLLESGGIDFETWTVGDSAVQTASCEALGVPRLQVRRKIAPELLRLNKEGALNGHVPISSILAFASVISAILRGKKYIVLSNEHSASESNTTWKGMEINHQWSKSLFFEQAFQQYVHENISPEIEYFSLLRPLSELRIAEIFAVQGWERFGSLFSSCNRNFHLTGSKIDTRWCGTCPKCVFVSLILSPWLVANQIEEAFGSIPFAESQNKDLMMELLGLQGIKPLECVGMIAEAREAVVLGAEKYLSLNSWAKKFPAPDFNHREFHPHALPKVFEEIIKKIQ